MFSRAQLEEDMRTALPARVVLCSYSWLIFDPPILNLGKLLAANGHTVVGIGLARSNDPLTEIVCPNFTVRRIPSAARFPLPLRFCIAVLALSRALRPRAIVAFNWNSFLIALLAGKLTRARLIYHQLEYNDRRAIRTHHPLLTHLLLTAERRLARSTATLFAAEPNRARLMRADYSLPYEPQVIYNAPLLGTISHSRSATTTTRPVKLLYIGGVNNATGCATVLRAFSTRSLHATLDIYGPIHPSFRDAFATYLSHSAAINNVVTYHGEVPYHSLSRIVPAYDVGLCLYQPDTLNQVYCAPCKLFEYLAGGLALIASDFPGLREIIQPPRCGVCIAPNDPLALCGAVEYLTTHPTVLAAMQHHSVNDYLTNYNFNRQALPLLNAIGVACA